MDATADELAGVVDLFGGLTRSELERALAELAFRTDGSSVDGKGLEASIEDALSAFAIVRYEPASGNAPEDPLFVAGPTAFPSPPDHAEDLPHILETEHRSIDRKRVGEQTRARYVAAVSDALEAGDRERIEELLEASYDVEAWAPIDLEDERDRLADALE
ncbi:DUF7109 family protein [Natrialbaceae archaeon A-gly3]